MFVIPKVQLQEECRSDNWLKPRGGKKKAKQRKDFPKGNGTLEKEGHQFRGQDLDQLGPLSLPPTMHTWCQQ